MIYAQVALNRESGATMAAATWPESDTIGNYSFHVHRPSRRHILAPWERSRDKGYSSWPLELDGASKRTEQPQARSRAWGS
ncbi:hypothetical protein HYPDE_38888 [Hyphomicrobium denitrificans 1NES1]|uniref:Uncharacterized protein n=1 Tax=Hyphomicrobium denitrificans 1NES1 TaxID=670307 RepID=N0BB37_9HYPH|nr:hypothetical protein HYPDE_38888 [Hyphomicrobium denitrificans 1NES1]